MTNTQKKTIERIKKMAEQTFYVKDKYEIKTVEIDENEYFVSLYIETGLIGDEGTLASVFGRDGAHFFIGKRGGITYPTYKNGKTITKRFERFDSFLTVVCAQRNDY